MLKFLYINSDKWAGWQVFRFHHYCAVIVIVIKYNKLLGGENYVYKALDAP